ncbi:MAG TPA: hemerythrin domain-containing protein [Anaeromyxobacteraceae bacterium]|nr:hemerythrin domain-containing protein [Anaeromyxobacteraceae bacterium]
MALKRTRELRPLSSDHHQALLVAYQLKKAIAGHAESAGAPRDLDGLLALARRYEETVFRVHTAAEEELLGRHLAAPDVRRLELEHAQMRQFLADARLAPPPERRQALLGFADLLERHVRWEERELFPRCEAQLGGEALESVGNEIEKRLVLAKSAAAHRA